MQHDPIDPRRPWHDYGCRCARCCPPGPSQHRSRVRAGLGGMLLFAALLLTVWLLGTALKVALGL